MNNGINNKTIFFKPNHVVNLTVFGMHHDNDITGCSSDDDAETKIQK